MKYNLVFVARLAKCWDRRDLSLLLAEIILRKLIFTTIFLDSFYIYANFILEMFSSHSFMNEIYKKIK